MHCLGRLTLWIFVSGGELDVSDGVLCMVSFPTPTWSIDLKASYATNQ